MIILVTGASASGKSRYAEELVLKQETGARIYIATMHAWDEESKERIRRHQEMRSRKRFVTVECTAGLKTLNLCDYLQQVSAVAGQGSPVTVLLECMSNLTANELFEQGGSERDVTGRILGGVLHLAKQAETLIIVTNEVFSDEGNYEKETKTYLNILGQINQQLAAIADEVIEVVFGIPVVLRK